MGRSRQEKRSFDGRPLQAFTVNSSGWESLKHCMVQLGVSRGLL